MEKAVCSAVQGASVLDGTITMNLGFRVFNLLEML